MAETATKRGCLWDARYGSYSGIVAWATHWHASLKGHDVDVEIGYLMTAEDAEAYSEPDFKYRAGDWSNKFPTQADAKDAAIVVFLHLAGDDDVLVGDGEVQSMKDAERGFALEQALLDDDWKAERAVTETFVPHLYDTHFGHGAPPSVRSKKEIVVERDPTTDLGFRVVSEEPR